MTRHFSAAAVSLLACALLVVTDAIAQQPQAQQQGQQQQQAVGAAAVRTRQNAQTIQIDQHQTPVIAVLYGQQQSETQIMALVSNPDQPQQDKEILFNRENANKRTVVHEGEQAGQARRVTLIARRGQEDVQIEKLAENHGIIVYGVRKPQPKQPEQPQAQQQQPAGQAPAGQAQPGQAQPAAAPQPPQDPAAAAQQAADKQKAAEAEAKRKAAEPKPDIYEAIVTVYVTTGR